WQLRWPPRSAQFAKLPPIQFIGQSPPDFIIGFGDGARVARETMQAYDRADMRYEQIATLDCFWQDLHRPELMLHSFGEIKGYDRATQAIYVFKRVAAAQ